MAAADRATTVHILLESAKGIDNAGAIAAIDGVDILHVGMNDLSVDLGHIGNLRHPEVLLACKRVITAARGHGKLAAAGGSSDPHFVSNYSIAAPRRSYLRRSILTCFRLDSISEPRNGRNGQTSGASNCSRSRTRPEVLDER